MTGSTTMRAGFLALLGGLLLAACNPPVDYGNPCRLTRPNGDGGLAFIPLDDPAIAQGSGFDFLATGDSDCEDLVCIRQKGKDYSQFDDGDPADDGTKLAHGECSTPCTDDTDCGDQARGLTCTQLAFDPAFLEQLKTNDPDTYKKYFGDSASANYCIDPTLADLSSQ